VQSLAVCGLGATDTFVPLLTQVVTVGLWLGPQSALLNLFCCSCPDQVKPIEVEVIEVHVVSEEQVVSFANPPCQVTRHWCGW
jgi:hypothetical protein